MAIRNFLSAEWRYLIMMNYKVEAALLKPYLPLHTVPDSFMGDHYVSLVGFLFQNTRVLGMKIPFHVNFEEVNLRFYVKRNIPEGERRGVVFISEIVPKPAIALIANKLFHENYRSLTMRHELKKDKLEVSYGWKYLSEWNTMQVTAENITAPIAMGSLEEFITEHYWGYNKMTASLTTEYRVEHPRWHVHHVKEYFLKCDFERLYGKDFAFLINKQPDSVLLAAGSEVKVQQGIIIHE